MVFGEKDRASIEHQTYELDDTTLDVFTYDTGIEGPTLLLLGAVHGNEPGGTKAIQKIQDQLKEKALQLKCGKIIMVPQVNKKAGEDGLRYLDQDFNRILNQETLHKKAGLTHEEKLVHLLAPVMQEADMMLDLHSFTAKDGATCVFADYPDEKVLEMAKASNAPFVITGWPEAFADHPEKQADGTETYMHSLGKPGITYEGGQHDDPKTKENLYQAIENVLILEGMLDGEIAPNAEQKIINVTQAVFNDELASGHYPKPARDFYNLEFVEEGTPIVVDGEDVLIGAGAGGSYILLPPAPGISRKRGEHLLFIGAPYQPEKAQESEKN